MNELRQWKPSPSLVIVSGPLKGAVVSLSEEAMSIGREPSNRLTIGDLALSRNHCCIKREDGGFAICDLESLNGTFVNGVPVKERKLEHGDLIRVGDSVLIFLLNEEPSAPPLSPVQVDDQLTLAGSTVKLRREDARYLAPDRIPAEVPAASRAAQDLKALLRITTEIQAIRSSEALQRKLLELTLEVVPADCGAILLSEEGKEGFASVVGWDRKGAGASASVPVSGTVARQVMTEGVALLSNDLSGSEKLNAAKTAIEPGVRSVLCAPLTVFDKTLGVLYLASRDPAAALDEDHLQLVTGIGGIAALALENACQMEWLEGETTRLRTDLDVDHRMVGESGAMKEVYQFVARVAPTDSTVLICGQSGTGKELVARAIHRNSRRASRPFVSLNCAALTETLLESELFGHEKGAFTGAVAQKQGKLEIANGGTVFLDEVGELSLALQVKLLRVLQEREFERVGGIRPIKVDVRWVAATNRNLEEAIGSGSFRQDLYYRLNVVALTLPLLRKRREDIPLLANYFVKKYSGQCKRKVRGLSPEARRCLLRYDWPGNVRELENAIERAVVLGSSERILPEDLPEAVLESDPAARSSISHFHEAVRGTKRELIRKAVEQAGGNYAEAARLLGLQRTYLHRLIRVLRLKEQLQK